MILTNLRVRIFLEHEPQQDRSHEDGSQRKDENGNIDGPWRLQVFYSNKPTDREQDNSQNNSNASFYDGKNIPHIVAPIDLDPPTPYKNCVTKGNMKFGGEGEGLAIRLRCLVRGMFSPSLIIDGTF